MRPASTKWDLSNLISTRKLSYTLTLYWKEWEVNNCECLHKRNKECKNIATTQTFLFIQAQSSALQFLSYCVKLRKTIISFVMYISQSRTGHRWLWRMNFASWVPKTTNAHSEYVMILAFRLQKWLHEYASMLCYTTLPVLFGCKITPQHSYSSPRVLLHLINQFLWYNR